MSSSSSLRPVFVGLDVHKDTIVAAVLDPSTGEISACREFRNDPTRLKRFVTRLRDDGFEPRCCYEASYCGYVPYRLLSQLDVDCAVIAPSLIPQRPGDHVKTDRRDAEKLAGLFAAGLLTAIAVPDEELESVRAMVRCRATYIGNLTRAKNRVTHLLHTRGHVYPGYNWTEAYWRWLHAIELRPTDQYVLDTHIQNVHFLQSQIQALEEQLTIEADRERFRPAVRALGAFRGIALITALTLVCEIGDIRRFTQPRELMSFLGLVPSERSSGNTLRRGSITKSGNLYARTALVSAAWKYAAKPRISAALKRRHEGLTPQVIGIAWKAQRRLYRRFHALAQRKHRSVAAVGVARELAGFVWAVMQHADTPTTT